MHKALRVLRLGVVAVILAGLLPNHSLAQSICEPLQRIFANRNSDFKRIKGPKPARGYAPGTVSLPGHTCEAGEAYRCFSGKKSKVEAEKISESNWNSAKRCFPNAEEAYPMQRSDGSKSYWIVHEDEWNFVFSAVRKNGGWVSEIELDNYDY